MTKPFDPDSEPAPSALDALRKVLLAREARSRDRIVHPRRSRVWLERTRDGDDPRYALTLAKGAERFELPVDALLDIARILDIGAGLLDRLRALSKGGEDEAIRLINKLLWHDGEDANFTLRLALRDGSVQRVFAGSYTPVRGFTLADCLEDEQRAGTLKLVRFDFRGAALRLVLAEGNLAPIGESRWRAGVLLLNYEDGGHAAVIVPALITPGGERVVPVVDTTAAVLRRPHRDASPVALAKSLIGDCRRAIRGAPFAEAVARLESLRSVGVAPGRAGVVLDAFGLKLPGRSAREAILRAVGDRATNEHAVLGAVLRYAMEMPPAARTALEIGAGRLVWTRGRLPRSYPDTPTSPTTPPS